MARGSDAGAIGSLVSLAGVFGRKNVGLEVKRPDANITFNPGIELFQNNPMRKWALIQNLDTANLSFSFDTGTGIAAAMLIPPGGVLQIDDNLPWTGPVFLASTTGVVTWMEASVQP